ncbi:MAG: hypothetical protein OEZ09_08750 [Betaproteobacteria bacterium]|nr:hypothetical protein [Betaproteobacteria bacterium]
MTLRLTAILGLTTLLLGCAPLPPEIQAERDSRRPLDVVVGPPVRLLDERPYYIAGLLSQDGKVHIFATDSEHRLHHFEIDGDNVSLRELVGTSGKKIETSTLAAVEWPPGTLRVSDGSAEFVRDGVHRTWRKTEPNRCARFAVAAGRLYCGFVMDGKDIGSPSRLDVYWGLMGILPIVIPVQSQSEKLVIAEAVEQDWILRAVLDVNDPLDAQRNFLMGADKQGFVDVLYAAKRGGLAFVIGPGGGAAGISPGRVVRHIRVSSDALSGTMRGDADKPAKPRLALVGRDIGFPPMPGHDEPPAQGGDDPGRFRGFVLNPATGTFEGLVHGFVAKGTLETGVHRFELVEDKWKQTATDFAFIWLTKGSCYMDVMALSADAAGTLHVVARSCIGASKYSYGYFRRHNGRWTKPVDLEVGAPPSRWRWEPYALLVARASSTYFVWTEEGSAFSDKAGSLWGRWIAPRTDAPH